jgi:hypothetical protein
VYGLLDEKDIHQIKASYAYSRQKLTVQTEGSYYFVEDEEKLYGTPVYGYLSVNKQIKNFLNLGVEWHDMFDTFCKEAKVNRHAVNIKVQYRF